MLNGNSHKPNEAPQLQTLYTIWMDSKNKFVNNLFGAKVELEIGRRASAYFMQGHQLRAPLIVFLILAVLDSQLAARTLVHSTWSVACNLRTRDSASIIKFSSLDVAKQLHTERATKKVRE